MSIVDDVKSAITKFDQTRNKYARYGAGDSEPDGVFQYILSQAIQGKPVSTETDWQLYSSSMDCSRASRALGRAAAEVVTIISKCPIGESAALRKYLVGYCWRISFSFEGDA